MSQSLTRQQIYDRIKASSKDSYILEEMKRLGFWQETSTPSLPEQLIQKEAVLQQELQELLAKDRKYGNQEAMLREMRKKRMQEAKAKREVTKQKNEQKLQDKADHWKRLQQQQIIYLGENVSKGLHKTDSDTEKLLQFSLPVFENILDFSQKSGYSLSVIKYLAFHRRVSKKSHYHIFEISKKSGGKRKISAPKSQLKGFQQWILDNILNKISVGEVVHGFTAKKSIVTNAEPHLGKDIIINIDLQDFFPSISYKRVKGLFVKLGYSEQLATIFALACTHAHTEEALLDGVKYFVHKGDRFLPQGSPASPAISNSIAYKLDKRLQGLALKLGFVYTRYADDLTFSTNDDNEQNINKLLYFVKQIIKDENFTVHPDKLHIMRRKHQQKVTGIVVNEKLNVERNKLRKFRALLHNIEVNGWQNQTWGKAFHLINAIEGYINFINMVNPSKALIFREKLNMIIAKHGKPIVETGKAIPEKVEVIEVSEIKEKIIAPKEDKTDWWNIF
ncbi:reverse transcriptase family protein [Chryseobacterium sp. BIGb0232]|uniref:reverse transcriptase family protein n=1 Tax=Chryseobacterium sp. BIGb0232 TaxID=2940598 RepID=UPI000F4632C7|nr:reverse transcriptase family protein [Chryseobacterium sp. BIGb0232]MCS4304839.1 retron-type reverse transcriptase [Chryseobacterium sp. BIGb0232]ROS09733.1 RNA-directed DNA polymerase [Chryseobacterium nakagawai]